MDGPERRGALYSEIPGVEPGVRVSEKKEEPLFRFLFLLSPKLVKTDSKSTLFEFLIERQRDGEVRCGERWFLAAFGRPGFGTFFLFFLFRFGTFFFAFGFGTFFFLIPLRHVLFSFPLRHVLFFQPASARSFFFFFSASARSFFISASARSFF